MGRPGGTPKRAGRKAQTAPLPSREDDPLGDYRRGQPEPEPESCRSETSST